MLDTFELAALKGELTSIHRIADMGLAAVGHAEHLQEQLDSADESLASASLRAHAAEQFVEKAAGLAEQHNAERDAKIAELEKRIAEHTCQGPTTMNFVGSPAQTEFEAELRRELQEARQQLQSHQTTVKLQAENNAKLKAEAERDRRELRNTLDQRQALTERIGAARACLALIDANTDEKSLADIGCIGVVTKVRAIVADGLRETSALKTEDGENLLIVLRGLRGDCELAQAESARLQVEVNGLREQIRQTQQDAAKSPAPDIVRLQQDLQASETARANAENRVAVLQQFADKPLFDQYERFCNRIIDACREGDAHGTISSMAEQALKDMGAPPF